MATSDKLQKLIDTKEAIRLAINEKGGSVTTSDTFASYPSFILELKSGSSSGNNEDNPSDFERIGYTFFPRYLSSLIDYSEEYRDKIESNNDNKLMQDSSLIYFPAIQLNDSIDTVTFSASNTSSSVFNTNFPNVVTFPAMDFKGKNINAGGNYGIFYNAKNLNQAYLNNAVLNYAKYLFYNCTSLQLATIKDCSALNSDFSYMFYGCTKLTNIVLDNFDFSNSTDLSYMFNGCSSLKNIKGIEDLNTSNVTNIQNMFNGASYDGELDLHKWDVSKVTNFNNFGYGAKISSFNFSGWNLESLSNVTTSAALLKYGSDQTKYIDCSNWNLPLVTQVPNIVESLPEGTINCSNWNLPSIKMLYNTNSTSATFVFGTRTSNTASAKKLDCSGWQLPNLTQFNPITRASNLQELDMSNWYVPNLTSVSFLHTDNTGVTILNIDGWDFSNFTNISLFSSSTPTLKNEFNVTGSFSGINVSSLFLSIPKLTLDSVIRFFNGLSEINDGTTHTVNVYKDTKNQLTEDQIAIATSKGWTIA